MHIEKKSLVNHKVAAATIITTRSIHSRHVDLSKPSPVRVLAASIRASGDSRVKYMG
jgi:hypothetical protein